MEQQFGLEQLSTLRFVVPTSYVGGLLEPAYCNRDLNADDLKKEYYADPFTGSVAPSPYLVCAPLFNGLPLKGRQAEDYMKAAEVAIMAHYPTHNVPINLNAFQRFREEQVRPAYQQYMVSTQMHFTNGHNWVSLTTFCGVCGAGRVHN